MRLAAPIRRSPPPGAEEGYILVAVMFMLAILIISMTIAIPRIREAIQRDHEIETMHRGKQYIRAIQLYYKKFHAYPPNVDALVKTNEIRFLRKRYTNPMTGKDDWKPIMFGQNKAPLAMGFFGQPLAVGAVVAGTGPGGGNGIAGTSPIGGTPGSDSGGSSFANGSSSSGGGSLSGGSSMPGGSSMFGSTGSSLSGGSSMFGSSSGSTTSGLGTGAGASSGSGSGGSANSGGSSSSGPGTGPSSNQTFGGGGIIGFSPGIEKPSILTYKKKNHYNEWEFTYSPVQDQKMMGAGGNQGTIGQPAGGTGGTGIFGNPSTGPGATTPTSPGAPTSPVAPVTPSQPQQ